MSSTKIDRVTEFSQRIEAISDRVVEALQRVDARLADLVAIEAHELDTPFDGMDRAAQPLAPVLHLPVPAVQHVRAPIVVAQRRSSVAPTAVAIAAGAVALVAGVMLLHARRR